MDKLNEVLKNTFEIINKYQGIPLSAKTLYGLSDLVSFGFKKTEERLSGLGMLYNLNEMIAIEEELYLEQETGKKITSNKKIEKAISFNYDTSQDEITIVSQFIRDLFSLRREFSMVQKTMGNIQKLYQKLVDGYYMIFVMLQRKNGDSKIMLDWLANEIETITNTQQTSVSAYNSSDNIFVICNTILQYFESNNNELPLIYSKDIKLSRKIAFDLKKDTTPSLST